MKQYFSVDMLSPKQFESIGIDIEDEKDAVNKALQIFAYKRQIEVLHLFYTMEPDAFFNTQPEAVADVLAHKSSSKVRSPYSAELMDKLEAVDTVLNDAWQAIESHVKKTKGKFGDPSEYLKQIGAKDGKDES